MKRAWMLGAGAAVVFAMGCSSGKPEQSEDFSADLQAADGKADTISTKKLNVVGSLDYNTQGTAYYSGSSKYLAFKFGGQKGDKVVIDVASKDGDSYAWLTDNLGKVIAKNDDYNHTLNSHIEATLPGNKNPDIVTYYIVFKEFWGDAAHMVVNLQSKTFCVDNVLCVMGTHWDSKACKCVPTTCFDNQFCRQGMHWDSTACQCVSDQQFCGGIAGIQCPAGQLCIDNPNDSCDPNNGGADCGGICVTPTGSSCAGFANIQCPTGQLCVDNPNDSCDPNHGGADCGGVCVQ